MSKDPRIKQLASEAARKIKTLTELLLACFAIFGFSGVTETLASTTQYPIGKKLMTDSYGDRVRQQLESAVKTARQESLQMFVKELMVALAKQDYRLDDLLDALTVYSQGRSDWSKVTEHLIAAAEGVRELRSCTNQEKPLSREWWV